jgi:hypothetical protein
MKSGDVVNQGQEEVLAAYRAAAHAEADAHFDERALEAQRVKIMARLAHLGESARVIRFPGVSRGSLPSTASVSRRWISVAAAAGLIIGLLGGQVMHLLPRNLVRPAVSPVVEQRPNPAIGPAVVPVVASADDDFFEEIDFALDLHAAPGLRTLDELTPFHEPR